MERRENGNKNEEKRRNRNDNNEQEEGEKKGEKEKVMVHCFCNAVSTRDKKLWMRSQCNKSWLSNFLNNESGGKRGEIVTFLLYQVQT